MVFTTAAMIKNYVIDTNVMIHDPKFLYNFEDNNIVIPIIAVEELDKLKKAPGVVGYHARSVLKELNKVRQYGNFLEGISLPNGGTIRIEMNHMDLSVLPDGMDRQTNDNKILTIAKNIALADADKPTIIVTKDMCMTVKGEALGLTVQDYENDKVHTEDLYKGYSEIYLSSEQINNIFKNGIELPKEYADAVYPNHFFHIKSHDNSSHEILAKYKNGKIVPLEYTNAAAWGLKPINREQKMAFELLFDANIHFASILGGAGSGKSILCVAYALQSVLEKGLYRKIIFVRPVVPAGNDIGYLPGDEKDKLKPWMSALYDTVDNLFHNKSKHREEDGPRVFKRGEKPDFSVEQFIDTYREMGLLEMKTFNYMRGRTLANALVIVDEAQETTPHLAKLMLTRAGEGSKFLFIGDPSDNQIDNVLVDSRSNGLVYTVDRMKSFDITGHITLQQVERSPLAQLAEKHM
ncbi:PhoH-like ATPase [Geosporobacter subterraneus DSM 17957]|uniref:PhoH-like ATPase n=1 Tax=Geosporobacter subterraneus DSM 17957 TaxID=1121919 RepID=A0A1M6PMM7_9FIRM|nr:PhoH family protein [Geosporobacter subterraneus]SHK09150.1 PhoH-like ATPase [Geosporobacter subterraneus DSM 17957]